MVDNKIVKKFTVIFAVFLFIISVGSNSYSQKDSSRKVYMVVANKLSLQDLQYMNNLKSIINSGNIGLMNTKGSIGYKGAESYLTINSSSRAYASDDMARAYNLTKENRSLHETRVGTMDKKYEVGNIDINRIIFANAERQYDTYIGALGDSLHSKGLKTAIFGNSDTDEEKIRLGSLIPMDSKGLIDYGNVDDILVKDNSYPYGVRLDYKKILQGINNIKEDTSLFVIDTGDLDRLNSYSLYLNDEMFMKHRENILKELDDFLGKLINNIDKDSILMIVSPSEGEERIDESKLAPVIMYEKDKQKGGILTSGTTRRNGIIANLDLAPTIANYLGTPINSFMGHNINSSSVENNLEFVNKLNEKTNFVSNARSPFLTIYSVITIIFLIVSCLLIYFDRIMNDKIRSVLKYATLFIMSMPLVFLTISLINIKNMVVFAIIALVMALILLFILSLIKDKYKLLFILLLTFLVLSMDIITGSNMTTFSILGYNPIIGARYFGIGNELTGVLMPTMLLATSLLLDNPKIKKYMLVLLPVSIIIVAHPNLGANVGGTISVLFASMIYVLLMIGIKIDLKKMLGICFGIVGCIFILGILDIYINPNPTHLGRMFLMISQRGSMFMTDIIVRKLQMNIKLMGNSIWGKVLCVNIIAMTTLMIISKEKLKRIFEKYKYLFIGIVSSIIGSIVGLLVNDSGVLLSAISSIFITGTIIYSILVNVERV
ncbi:alkaline phosphatase-like protein [Gottschalkia purinilytica]|uniref:Alkaline phosphatase-like protein n=1 Tax=Gottschalkia purinilytica TaxID=1503 RepID=A0A0L0WEH7_GOTPU|nr:hypothetical protein [Gottschalkia purinilytica]KNF09883.1 alkaline phosphatase-like protein [Gottschalkia purinilytica]